MFGLKKNNSQDEGMSFEIVLLVFAAVNVFLAYLNLGYYETNFWMYVLFVGIFSLLIYKIQTYDNILVKIASFSWFVANGVVLFVLCLSNPFNDPVSGTSFSFILLVSAVIGWLFVRKNYKLAFIASILSPIVFILFYIISYLICIFMNACTFDIPM